jgi:NAD(P)-dependent dehydrogenase (short-subunit alcohol dehydrogenase family)
MNLELTGKACIVTGATRGIGLATTRTLCAEGARVLVVGRDPERASDAAQEAARAGGETAPLALDVTDADAGEAAVEACRERFGALDVLVNNAGTISVGPMDVMTVEDYELAMRTHFWGPLYTTLAALPVMRGRGDGRIVNISSIGGKIAVPHLLPYSASKFALTGFSEGLRAELLREGIYVTTVCPGLMRTGSPRNAKFKGRHRAEYAWFAISDALPLTSMDAGRAARRIVEACRYGEAEVVLSVQAKLAVTFHDLFPGLTADINGLFNRMLPDAGPATPEAKLGRQSKSKWAPSWLTVLNDRAARENNEIG